MLPRLVHIPPRAIRRIPGPPVIGTRRARAIWGLGSDTTYAGLPDGFTVDQFFADTGGPLWFAVSDMGAGFIPWGFWQIALYPDTSPPAPITPNLSFAQDVVNIAATASDLSNILLADLSGLFFRAFLAGAQFIAAGGATSTQDPHKWNIRQGPIQGSPPSGGHDQLILEAPLGCTQLQSFYTGYGWPDPFQGIPPDVPMVGDITGYDNPLFLALWSPGNRAILRAVAQGDTPSYPYGRYPYPSPPPQQPGGET